MKKNLFALAALVAAITLSSFSTSSRAVYYLAFTGSDPAVAADYSFVSSTRVGGTGKFNWIGIEDADGTIDNSELAVAIAAQNLNTAPATHPLDNEADRTLLDVKTP